MIKLQEIRANYFTNSGVSQIKDRVDAVNRVIEFDPSTLMVRISKWSALDGSVKDTFLNLNSAWVFEYDVLKEDTIAVDQNIST